MTRWLSHSALLVLCLGGCKKGTAASATPPPAPEIAPEKPVRPAPKGPSGPATPPVPSIADDWPGTDGQLAMYRALSVKDPAPTCAEVEALDPEPLAGLKLIAEEIAMPPYAGMRAATCIVTGHAEAGSDIIVGWMGAPDFGGLVRLALQHVDSWPEPVQTRVREAALAGPHAAVAQPLLERASD